jgi:exopolysaccharide production protein ExoZ
LRKIQNIQALRGVAVLSVVLFHLVIIERKYGGAETILPNFFNFGIFGVDLFFVISGFVMVAVTRGRFRDLKQALLFLYHRASRIYPAYWIYSILVLCVFLIKPSLVNSSQGNHVDLLSSFLLLPSKTLPLVMVGWTLIHEMYFYLIFFFVMLTMKERRMPFAILLWGIGIIFLNIIQASSSPFYKLVSHPLTVEFIGGCFLAILFYRESSRVRAARSLLFVTAMGVIAAVYGHSFYQRMTGQIDPQGWWRILIFGAPAALLVFCAVNAEKNGKIFHSSLGKIGDASYSIYLSHILTLSVAGRLWSLFSSNAAYDNIFMIPLFLLLTIIVGIFSYRFIEMPLLGVSRRILQPDVFSKTARGAQQGQA